MACGKTDNMVLYKNYLVSKFPYMKVCVTEQKSVSWNEFSNFWKSTTAERPVNETEDPSKKLFDKKVLDGICTGVKNYYDSKISRYCPMNTPVNATLVISYPEFRNGIVRGNGSNDTQVDVYFEILFEGDLELLS